MAHQINDRDGISRVDSFEAWLIRALDISLSILGIMAASPVIAVIFILGFADTGSPLFTQRRVGRDCVPFTLVKFRTMVKNTESVGSHLVDSAAVTGFGGFLRKTKLDELPQLLNVLLGHMSLVGPRPCLPNQQELIAERSKRGVFSVRPGITGLAQINDIDMSNPRKLARYDQKMIMNLNLGLYLCLIFQTAAGKGRGDRVRQIHDRR